MKKQLLTIFLAAMTCGLYAQPQLQNDWTKSQSDIISVDAANNSNPMAITLQNEVYATGVFNAEFTFGGHVLEHLANSSYLVKYSATGAEMWGVSLYGAATIKAITTDTEGNVYIAGNIADEVVFNTTSGEPISLYGAIAPDGTTYYTKQSVGFIAKYNADGALQSAKAFTPQALPVFATQGTEDGENFFNINKIEFNEGQLYLSALYTGSTTFDNLTFEGSYLDYFGGGFMFINLKCASVFSLDSDLNATGIVAQLGVDQPQSGSEMNVLSCSFAINDGMLYSGFVANGDQKLTVGSTSELYNLAIPGDGNVEYGYIMSVINLGDNRLLTSKKYSTTHDAFGNKCTINNMMANNNVLFVTGTFNTTLAFDDTQTSTTTNDIYFASLNKSTLDVNWANISGVNEGATNQDEEVISASALVTDYAYVGGYIAKISGSAYQSSLGFWVKLASGEVVVDAPANACTGIASMDTKLASASYNNATPSENTFKLQTIIPSSVSNIDKENSILIYPNPVVDVLNFSKECDVVVANMVGAIVKQANNVTSMNVSDLTMGTYIVRVTTNDTVNTYKVLKK